ncbi:GAF domain-containing protein [Mycolicibacterium sp. YH-1]|uniref:GAF domain-containing protein n=1 Tax=Mycolicibacterium sp. YH-1 TaxID=2908837 RepID=UPI001F4C1916|nr:GAF domain-containing protein [Mycolicibacterium sp. YH-1]UNB51351.1 GAF domain-containing protein [Mycolicibacterium sp. YH-1]
MTSGPASFDEWLNRVLAELAREASEEVETYIARAVASRMVADRRRTDSGPVDELLAHLAEAGVFADTAMPNISAAITDPDRLRSLYATELLDSPPEAIYDRITRAAADALDAPFALVTLVDADRQFFKSSAGMEISSPEERQTPLNRSVCQYAVANGAPLILEDARVDPVFKNHPAVRDGTVVAYLGIPLVDQAGMAIGTLCVFDTKPRLWGTGHVQVLSDLAALAAERIFGTGASPNR